MENQNVEDMVAAICDEPVAAPEPEAESSAHVEPTEESGAEPEEAEAEEEEFTQEDEHLAEEKPRKEKPVEKRISELTRKRYEAERQAEYWRQQAEARAAQQPVQAEDEPNIEDYPVYEDYVRDLARYQARQIVAEETRKMQETQARQVQEKEQQERIARARKEVDKAVEKHEDFYEALDVVTALPIPQLTSDAIMDSPVVADIIYHLGKNPDEADRIAALPPLAQIKEIGKIEDKIMGRKTLQQKQVKQPTRVEKAGEGIPSKGPDLDALWKHGKRTGDFTDYYKATGIIG